MNNKYVEGILELLKQTEISKKNLEPLEPDLSNNLSIHIALIPTELDSMLSAFMINVVPPN